VGLESHHEVISEPYQGRPPATLDLGRPRRFAPTSGSASGYWILPATYIQHLQKALTQMNVQLHHVVSDITGVTGMRIVRAIVAGERDAATLAAFRDSRCKEPVETIREALIGNYREEHVFALTQALKNASDASPLARIVVIIFSMSTITTSLLSKPDRTFASHPA
jgi:hypothetical protein